MKSTIGKAAKDLLHSLEHKNSPDFLRLSPGNVDSIIADGMPRATCLWNNNDDNRAGAEALLVAEITRGLEACDSPIERDMLAALATAHWGLDDYKYPEVHVFEKGVDEYPKGPVVIIPQFVISRFRLDFAVIYKSRHGGSIYAVECDGKGYHDPANDRERDAYLSCFGIKTFRATGAEIIKDPISLSNKIVQQITIGK